MNNVAFTICSRSYIGMANVLRHSFLKNHNNYDFFIVLADTDSEEVENCIYAEKILNDKISVEKYEEMAFKYDVTEFCTSLKPFILNYFLEQKYELAVYIDPDICFYSHFSELDDKSKSIYITPHIITMRSNYDGDEKEENFLKYGIYNCGFIAFRRTHISFSVLQWWSEKLFDYSFADAEWGVYTDQKWIDFLPNFVPTNELSIIHNYGCNIAPWNFYEREIFMKNDSYYVKERNGNSDENELVFIHFSGYNYLKLINGIIEHNHRKMKNYEDLNYFILKYGEDLKFNKASEGFSKGYKYNKFSNGDVIFKFHRRLYRQLLIQNYHYDNLFSFKGQMYEILMNNKMIVHNGGDVKSKSSVSNIDSKRRLLNYFYKLTFRLLGVRRFVEFLTALQMYSRFETQVELLKM